MFARFDENSAMTVRVIKETKRYGRTDGRTHGWTDRRTDNVKTVYPLQTKFAGGIITTFNSARYFRLMGVFACWVRCVNWHPPCLRLCTYICNKYENIMHWPIYFTALLAIPFLHGVKCCTGNNEYILISWLLQKPADLDVHSFQENISRFGYINSKMYHQKGN